MTGSFELTNITSTILREIENKKMKQADIAKTYALAINSIEQVDFPEINRAIIARWSKSGLNRIKVLAWKSV